ncbi:MAG TPA: hypothetical protein VFP26_13905 [Gemmatimonadaceae bacterium]|nr:hypothetical protein [Gemmatimonadaceae bacterium]
MEGGGVSPYAVSYRVGRGAPPRLAVFVAEWSEEHTRRALDRRYLGTGKSE